MGRFIGYEHYGRAQGPALGAAHDGLAQGTVYTALIKSAVSAGTVKVAIPALHLTELFTAHVQPGTPCKEGETACVVFDEQKTPWVLTGLWGAPTLTALEAEMATAEGKIATLEAHLATAEAKLADSGWVEPALLNAWVNGTVKVAYRKQGNVVRLRGELKGASGATGTTVFVLPAAFRPTTSEQYAGVQGEAHGVSHVRVETNGNVAVFFDGAAGNFLSGVTFTAD